MTVSQDLSGLCRDPVVTVLVLEPSVGFERLGVLSPDGS
jgi:hypothetical protein